MCSPERCIAGGESRLLSDHYFEFNEIIIVDGSERGSSVNAFLLPVWLIVVVEKLGAVQCHWMDGCSDISSAQQLLQMNNWPQ